MENLIMHMAEVNFCYPFLSKMYILFDFLTSNRVDFEKHSFQFEKLSMIDSNFLAEKKYTDCK